MTCQHCQTWILDVDHRCQRCGRRARANASRISPATYPIAAAATAQAYDFTPEQVLEPVPSGARLPVELGQQPLFANPVNGPRVIPFASLTSPAERTAIRIRAAEDRRPVPVKSDRVEVRRARSKRNYRDQAELEFRNHEEVRTQRPSDVICDAPVATAGLRLQAAVFDGLMMVCGILTAASLFVMAGGHLVADKHLLPFVLAALLTVPVFYKVLWAFAGRDSLGMRMARLELVDFDGRVPTRRRRYARLAGGIISVLAAGVGLAWSLLDEDRLTWHDHISSTFPTFASDSELD